jgi:hypothetical protein
MSHPALPWLIFQAKDSLIISIYFKSTPQSYYLVINMLFLDVLPFLLLIGLPLALAQSVMQEYNALQLDVDLSLAGPAYS